MTIKQRIRKCLKSWDGETDTIEKIVAVAYYMGREDAAREICNKAENIFREQMKRAMQCRYRNTAIKVQGNVRIIYSPDYSCTVGDTFGEDDTNI